MTNIPERSHVTAPARHHLAALIEREYALVLAEVHPIQGGWDPTAAVWTAFGTDGEQYGIKVSRRDVTFGIAVTASLTEAGVGGIVRPLSTRTGRLWLDDDNHIIVVFPWIDGVDAVDHGADSVDWFELGRLLRAVHSHPSPEDARPHRRGIRRTRRSSQRLLDDVQAAYATDSTVQPTQPDQLAQLWATSAPRLRRLARAASVLKRTRSRATRVTTHGDPHLGNVMLDRDGRPWLIDFDEATIAPREVDLMLVELGVLFDTPLSDAHRTRFRDGYGRDVAIDRDRIIRFGCVRAIEDAAFAFLDARTADPQDPAPIRMLDGILGPHGLVSLVESELERLPHSRALTDTKDER